MKENKRIIMSIIWVVLGGTLIALGFLGKVDSFWNGAGSGLAGVGVLQLLRYHRFKRNPDYREKVEVEYSDERNHFIRSKAWAWTGYIFVLAGSVSVVVLKLLREELLSMAVGAAVCFVLIVYWSSYMILKKKY